MKGCGEAIAAFPAIGNATRRAGFECRRTRREGHAGARLFAKPIDFTAVFRALRQLIPSPPA